MRISSSNPSNSSSVPEHGTCMVLKGWESMKESVLDHEISSKFGIVMSATT
jgi:hypothetical protein